MAYPKTDKEYVAKLELAATIPNGYDQPYPYNCGYFDGERTTWDCVNLNKTIINGWEYSDRPGSFCNDFSRTGDCTEWGLLSQCEYSTNFSKMDCVAVLYMPGHIGNYIGKEVTKNGKVYNVIECTGAWGGGVLYSYVDKYGRRFNHMGGTQNGSWTHWGKMVKWLKYTEEQKMDFKDVPETHPKYSHIKACYKAGLIKGFSDGTFRPDEPITRGDLCIVMNRLMKKLGVK